MKGSPMQGKAVVSGMVIIFVVLLNWVAGLGVRSSYSSEWGWIIAIGILVAFILGFVILLFVVVSVYKR